MNDFIKIKSALKYIKNYGIKQSIQRYELYKNKDLNVVNNYKSVYSEEKKYSIDIVIPVIEKDLEMLELVVSSCKKNILHNIENIFVIAPQQDIIVTECNRLNIEFINENDILPITKKDIVYNVDGNDRSGWIYQQLLKLNCDEISKSKYILLMDSDTVWIRPRKFIDKNEKLILDWSDEFHNTYRETYNKIMGTKPKSCVSFVAHCMIIDRHKIKELKKHIEKNNDNIWFEAILNNLPKDENSSFSEYETYGNFVLENYKNDIVLEYWFNNSLKRKYINEIYNEENKQKYKSLSFHDHLND